jgi:hypothetical protein
VKAAAVAAGAAILAAGCGGGPRVEERRAVAPFERIDVADNFDVTVVPGNGREVTVRARRDVIDRVRTESWGGVLRLDIVDRGIVIGPDPLDDVGVLVAASSLRGVELDGSGDVALDRIDEDALALEVHGAGDVEANGTVDRLDAVVSGAGDANLFGLAARTARVQVTDAGDAEVTVSDALDVEVTGAGDVAYRGEPTVESTVTGAGDLRRSG